MHGRTAIMLLTAAALAACEVGGTDTAGNAALAQLPDGAARTGMVVVGGQAYPFSVRTCAIGGPKMHRTFMVVGEGNGPDGSRYAVNADGSAEVVAVVLRKHQHLSFPAEVFRSRFSIKQVSVERRTISASGEFQSRAGGPPLTGSFAVDCG